MVHCKFAHIVPGTQDQQQTKYIVINKKEQLNLKLQTNQGEMLISSTKAKVGGNDAIVAVSNH
jgi:hypothetical protein